MPLLDSQKTTADLIDERVRLERRLARVKGIIEKRKLDSHDDTPRNGIDPSWEEACRSTG